MVDTERLLQLTGVVFASSPMPCLGFDRRDEKILIANDALVRSFGHSREELGAMTTTQLWGDRPTAAADRGPASVRLKDGTHRDVDLTTLARFFFEGVEVEVLQADDDVSGHRRAHAELAHARDQLRAMTARLVSAEDAERRRVSRELHDHVNQQLALLTMEVDGLEAKLRSTRDQLPEQLHAVKTGLAQVTEQIRQVAYQLHPSVLDDLGLSIAAKYYAEAFSRRENIELDFDAAELPPLHEDLSTCLYRVLQEALRNVSQHAQAQRVTVALSAEAGTVTLQVSDDGVGFEPADLRISGRAGLGVVSMRERVELLGGTFAITSRPGQGTELDARLPLEAAR